MRIAICLLVCTILLASCSSGKRSHFPSKEFVIAAGIPIGDINPLATRSGIGANLIELLYRPLFKIGPNREILPELAASIQWGDEAQTILKVSLDKISASDVKATIDQVRKLSGGDLSEGLKSLKSVEVASNNEVIFKLERFDRAFLILLSQIPMVAYSQEKKETGDFFLVSKGEDEVLLQRSAPSLDHVNSIRVKVIPSTKRAIRELVAGNVDLIFFARQSEYGVLDDLPEVKVELMNTRMLYQVLENRRSISIGKKINWKMVRESINPSSFSDEMGESQSRLPGAPIPRSDPWFFEPAAKASSEVLEKSRGMPLNNARSLSFLGEQARDRRVARLFKRSMESLGVDIQLIDLSPGEFEKSIFRDNKFDLVLLPFNIKDTLISNYLVFHSPDGPFSLNFSGYSNSEVDEYFKEARYTKGDAQAKVAFVKAMEAMREDPPGMFLFWLKTPIVYRRSCEGFKLNSSEFFSSLKDVRCEPSVAN